MGSPLQTPSTWEVRLSELLSLSVPVQWPEAVAVVRRVAVEAGGATTTARVTDLTARTQRSDDTDPTTALVWPPPVAELAALEYVDTIHGVPDPSGIWLTTEGSVRLEAAVGTPGQVVTRLGLLLRALLPASAPPDLEMLGDPATSSPRITSGKEFLEKLTYFARPDDSQEIRALVARVLETRLSDERNRTLQALTDRARHSLPVEELVTGKTRKALPVSRLLVVAGCLAAVLGFSGGLWLLTRSSVATPVEAQAETSAPQSAARLVQNKLASAAAVVTQALTGQGEQPAAPTHSADLHLPSVRRRAERVDPTPPVTAPPGVATEAAAPFEVRGSDGAPQERELPAGSAVPDALAAGHGVYSSAQPDVVPPTLIRSQMPQVPIRGVPITAPGVLEIVVGDDGQVVSARLVPRSNRYQDRMMVSAAKTWRFAPARRYGQPVRYRLEMPITW